MINLSNTVPIQVANIQIVGSVTVPTGLDPGLVGQQLDFAYIVVGAASGGVVFASNAKPLVFAP